LGRKERILPEERFGNEPLEIMKLMPNKRTGKKKNA